MPTYVLELETWTGNSLSLTQHWQNPDNAETVDGVTSDSTPASLSTVSTDYLLGIIGSGSAPSFAGNEVLDSVTVDVYRNGTSSAYGASNYVVDQHLYLVSADAAVTTVDKAFPLIHWPNTIGQQSYGFTPADLSSDGITKTNVDTNFGVALTATLNIAQDCQAHVDAIVVTLNTHLTGGGGNGWAPTDGLPSEFTIYPKCGRFKVL